MCTEDHPQKQQSHNRTDSGLSAAVGFLGFGFVSYHHSLVAELTVQGAPTAAQVVGRWRFLELHLLLLPDKQRCVFEPETSVSLRHRLLR